MGLGQLNQANLNPARHEFKRRPTQLNLSPIGARNQRQFAPNPSSIRIRIPNYTSVSIFGITFGSDVQLRWFKLGWKGLQFCSLPKVLIQTLNWLKSSVKWSLKIWDFLQTGVQLVIGFLDLFKGFLGQNSRRRVLGLRAKCIESCSYLFHDS